MGAERRVEAEKINAQQEKLTKKEELMKAGVALGATAGGPLGGTMDTSIFGNPQSVGATTLLERELR